MSDQAKKILIVEDDITISTLYGIKFEKEGYIVKVCSDGMDAVTHVMDFAPDVILLDIMMPAMDGFETLRVIRELAPSLQAKIVMFSNLNRQNDIDRYMSGGADAYLLKADTTPKDAVAKVEELLAYRKEQEETVTEARNIQCHCPHCGGEFEQKVI